MKVTVIKCKNCGAPMSPDVDNNRFLCAFCGSWKAFSEFTYQLPIIFRHQPLKVVDGLLKLGHVYIEEAVNYANASGDHFEFYNLRKSENCEKRNDHRERLHRWSSTESKIEAYAPETYRTLANKTKVRFNCKSCGGEIHGYSTQMLFKCPYCHTIIGDADVIESSYCRENQIIGDRHWIHDWQLPFNIKRIRAKSLIKELVISHPEAFADIPFSALVSDENLTAVYVPHELSDLRIRTQVKSERRDTWFYSEWFNWALPSNHFYDAVLLDALQPWDFGRMQTFNPAYLEEEVRIVGLCNGWDRVSTMEHILLNALPREIAQTYGLNKVRLLRWSYDNRRHQFGYMALPIYHSEIVGDNGQVSVRIMINGQTGRTVAVIPQKSDLHYELDPEYQEMTYECSMHSKPIPVRYVKSPFLYEIGHFV